ncbi:exopolysaccharide biosynthesis polyprenyl glycosylphosphotransferase [Streptomyces sp. NPDC014734]|uniref:exopolysaccharide biosynthesis polyprenyl glycosylphosphotransferase n=1 Tax=Streptomyces sp. NPDC014734 TaxID=3364886 RepID=UPI00370164C9
MGHVELPDSDRSGSAGPARAPRPRTVPHQPRGEERVRPRGASAASRGRPGPAPARRPTGRRVPALVGGELLGLGLPAWLVLWSGGEPRAVVAAAVAALAWSGVRAARGRYAARAESDPPEPPEPLSTIGDWLLLIGLLAVLQTLTGDLVDPVTVLLALLPGLPVGPLLRWLSRTGRRRRSVRRVLVVGETPGVERAVRLLGSRTDHPYAVVAAVPVGAAALECAVRSSGRLASSPAVDDASAVLGAAFAHDADLALVVPGPGLSEERLRRLFWGLHDGGLPLSVLSDLTGVAAGRVRPVAAAGLTLLHIAPPLRRGPQTVLKSVVDRVGAALGLLVLAPLLLLIATAVRVGSDGPAFHRQIRQGLHNRPFTMWKFRTMVVDAERLRHRLTAANESDGPMFKMRRDPRVTAVGRLLRRTSLDELPQLVNVLRGDMSLVGPRPPLPDEVSRYDERELRRLAVRPGLTGLWQVSGRSDLSWQETVSLDLWYVDNWSVATDLGLMARTLRAVADGRGAY